MDLITDVTKTTIELFPEATREALRTTIADNLARILIDQQLEKLRRQAIDTVRLAILPTVDAAIAAAFEAMEHSDDATWSQFEKLLAEAPVKN
jgi:hypothetical protein